MADASTCLLYIADTEFVRGDEMSKLALLGGRPVREKPFPKHPYLGDEEKKAVLEVLERGELSAFLAVPGQYFNGGRKIKELEQRFAEYHGVEHAVAFNSATAALHAAVVAVGVEPGDEVIVPPYTFTSTATSVLMHNAIPVFADVQDDIFCLDPKAAEDAVTDLTRAVIPVHLFGHPANMARVMAFARKHDLKVIEDCAQAPGARYSGKPVGTIGDCGIFSFTENKNITSGEGGMLITNDLALAETARQVRNHGEVILASQKARSYRPTMLGWNYRMTEMEAALGVVQFDKMDDLNDSRRKLANHITGHLSGTPALTPPVVYPDCRHVFYIYALRYNEQAAYIPRNLFVEAVQAEGIPMAAGYVHPLYASPIYHERRPFAYKHYRGKAQYDDGICPVCERLHERELVLTQIARPPATTDDMDDVVAAIEKVLEGAAKLKDHGPVPPPCEQCMLRGVSR